MAQGPAYPRQVSERGPAFLGDEHDPWKIRMSNPAAANVIAEYLNSGGQVRKGDEPTPATAQEIIVYLASRGIPARYCPGDAKLYLCRGKRMSAGKLVEIANRFRRAENLQPFALKLDPLDLKAGSGDLRSSM